jgi:SpoVK/Ycf46/Vps4 family AAA+-type ATPase
MSMKSTKFPSPKSLVEWESLIGLQEEKETLLENLTLLLSPENFQEWLRKYHPKGIRLSTLINTTTPFVILSGDVGCGKTFLARCIGEPLSKKLDAHITLLESPTDIRGTGLVGEISARISSTFEEAKKAAATAKNGYTLLLLDEGDDIATSREQLQAHHEDRAGVNSLIKELDKLQALRVAVILITNRKESLDPALLRRASLHIDFSRPNGKALDLLIKNLVEGIKVTETELQQLRDQCDNRKILYTTSDLIHRVGRKALITAYQQKRSLLVADFVQAVETTEPTPIFKDQKAWDEK